MQKNIFKTLVFVILLISLFGCGTNKFFSTSEILLTSADGDKLTQQENVKFRRSLYFTKDIDSGSIITSEDIRSIRPGYGLHPKYFDQVIGKKVSRYRSKGDPLSEDDIVNFIP